MSAPDLLPNVSCVAIGRRGVMIEGAVASGKSSLALALLDRGAVLVGDDGIALEQRGDALWALPPPNIAGKVEVRGVGLIDVPCAPAQLCLALILDREARYTAGVEPTARDIAGIALPCLVLRSDDPVLALKAEAALALHGLPLAGTMV